MEITDRRRLSNSAHLSRIRRSVILARRHTGRMQLSRRQPRNPPRLDVVSFETGTIIKSFEVLTIAFNYRAVRWTPAGDALIFAKNDKPASNLWKQDLAGGEPKQFTDFSSQRIYYHAFSRDGKRLLISRGEVKVNVVMLRNFSESAGQ